MGETKKKKLVWRTKQKTKKNWGERKLIFEGVPHKIYIFGEVEVPPSLVLGPPMYACNKGKLPIFFLVGSILHLRKPY